MENEVRNSRRTRIGIVVSDKMDKTIIVAVNNKVKHPIYGKHINRTKKYKAHDELEQANIGDTVEIMETRLISKDKYHRLVRIVERAK